MERLYDSGDFLGGFIVDTGPQGRVRGSYY